MFPQKTRQIISWCCGGTIAGRRMTAGSTLLSFDILYVVAVPAYLGGVIFYHFFKNLDHVKPSPGPSVCGTKALLARVVLATHLKLVLGNVSFRTLSLWMIFDVRCSVEILATRIHLDSMKCMYDTAQNIEFP